MFYFLCFYLQTIMQLVKEMYSLTRTIRSILIRAVTLLTCISKLRRSNLSQNTIYSLKFSLVSQSMKQCRNSPWASPWLLPRQSFLNFTDCDHSIIVCLTLSNKGTWYSIVKLYTTHPHPPTRIVFAINIIGRFAVTRY